MNAFLVVFKGYEFADSAAPKVYNLGTTKLLQRYPTSVRKSLVIWNNGGEYYNKNIIVIATQQIYQKKKNNISRQQLNMLAGLRIGQVILQTSAQIKIPAIQNLM